MSKVKKKKKKIAHVHEKQAEEQAPSDLLHPPPLHAPSPPTPPSYMSVMKAPVMPVFRGEHGNNK